MEICNGLRSNKLLQRECAEILEQMKQYADAATLYEAAQYFDKAAYQYIKLKDWVKIGKLLPHISSPKIQVSTAAFCIACQNALSQNFLLMMISNDSWPTLKPKSPTIDTKKL